MKKIKTYLYNQIERFCEQFQYKKKYVRKIARTLEVFIKRCAVNCYMEASKIPKLPLKWNNRNVYIL